MDFMSAAQLLGNIGEFVGAILLFVSLIYIGIQIRQNTRATAAEVYQSRALGAQDYFLHQAADPELADIFLRIEEGGTDEINKLTDNQRRRYTAWHLAGLARLDNSYYQFIHGFLDPEYYDDRCHHDLWDETDPFCQQDDTNEEEDTAQHRRYPGPSAGLVIGNTATNKAGSCQATEKCRNSIADPLPYQLLIGIGTEVCDIL